MGLGIFEVSDGGGWSRLKYILVRSVDLVGGREYNA